MAASCGRGRGGWGGGVVAVTRHAPDDGNMAALADYEREQDALEDDDEGFWEAHERDFQAYRDMRFPQPGAVMVVPEEWEE